MSKDELCVYIDLFLEQLSVVSSDVWKEGPEELAAKQTSKMQSL